MNFQELIDNLLSSTLMLSLIVCFIVIGKYIFKGNTRINKKSITIFSIFLLIYPHFINIVNSDNVNIETIANGEDLVAAWISLLPNILLTTIPIILFLGNINKIKFILFSECFLGIIILPILNFISHVFNQPLDRQNLYRTLSAIFIFNLINVVIVLFSKSKYFNIISEAFTSLSKWILFLIIYTIGAVLNAKLTTIPENKKLYTFISIVLIVVCIAYFVYRFFKLLIKQNEILAHMHTQKEYSEKLITNDDELRRFRHDYRNHMIVINSLFENGQTDRAREYINNMNNSVSSSLTKISTGNFISDALINNKAVAAADHDISIKFTGQVIPSGIADEDLCTILSNTLDNAIEATQKLSGNKTINIDAALRNGFFIMNISNPVENDVKIRRDGTVKTSKKNSANHGYGMRNVQRAVHKYNGTVLSTCENKIFSVDIMLKPTI